MIMPMTTHHDHAHTMICDCVPNLAPFAPPGGRGCVAHELRTPATWWCKGCQIGDAVTYHAALGYKLEICWCCFICNPDPCSQQHVHDTLAGPQPATQQCWGWLAGWAA